MNNKVAEGLKGWTKLVITGDVTAAIDRYCRIK